MQRRACAMMACLLLLSTSCAGAQPLSDYLKQGVLGKLTSKVLSHATLVVLVDNAALWQTPLPYYWSLFKADAKSPSGYTALEQRILVLHADALRPEQLEPTTANESQTGFSQTLTLYPGTYRVVLHSGNDCNPNAPGAASPWLLPQVQSFEIGAKPHDQTIELRLRGYPEVRAE